MKSRYMTNKEEEKYFERNKECNLRFIHAKLPSATPKELGLIAYFIQGLGVIGWCLIANTTER